VILLCDPYHLVLLLDEHLAHLSVLALHHSEAVRHFPDYVLVLARLGLLPLHHLPVAVHPLTPELVVLLEFRLKFLLNSLQARIIFGPESLLDGVLGEEELGLALAGRVWLRFGSLA
jgi:hypothetical protein